jgi:hypothetical protein
MTINYVLKFFFNSSFVLHFMFTLNMLKCVFDNEKSGSLLIRIFELYVNLNSALTRYDPVQCTQYLGGSVLSIRTSY